MSKDRKVFWVLLGIIVALAVVFEFIPVLDGLLPSGTMTEFVIQYAVIIFTLCDMYLALRLIKHNPILRIILLFVPALANVLFYHLFMNTSFFYLLIMIFIAIDFVYPPKDTEKE